MVDVEAASGLTEMLGEFGMRNYSDVPDDVLRNDPQMRHLQTELARWASNGQRKSTMFDRDAYTPPNNPYDEMRSARLAIADDDIVSGVADITEAFALQGMKFESVNVDEADVFNQWAARVNMDDVLRQMWREEYTLSQVVLAMRWDWMTFRVRGRLVAETTDQADTVPDQGDGPAEKAAVKRRPRRKTYKLWVPTKITVLDSSKIVPIGGSPLAPEQLAWCATESEMSYWEGVQAGRIVDFDMATFYTGRYVPTEAERRRLNQLGVPSADRLLLLNPEFVFRHTLTKADYEAFPTLRMKSLFPLLDLKRQLIASDRASLVGAANYILLVKKGSDQKPAVPEEIDALKQNFNFIAKLPVIISDHRLNIEIIAPKIDLTLQGDRYDTLDTRILMRLLGTLSLGSKGQRNETNLTLSHTVARMMQNRRHMLKRAIERDIVRQIVEHPNNQGPSNAIKEEPNMVFVPRNVALSTDAALIQALVSLRTQREISRETLLEQFDLDQATEAMRLEYEAEVYDDIFKTQIPFAASGVNDPNADPSAEHPNDTGDPTTNGAQGGRPIGGGKPADNATQVPGKTAGGNTKKGQS